MTLAEIKELFDHLDLNIRSSNGSGQLFGPTNSEIVVHGAALPSGVESHSQRDASLLIRAREWLQERKKLAVCVNDSTEAKSEFLLDFLHRFVEAA